MAYNEAGEPRFCRGCSVAGNYVGPITESTKWYTVEASHSGDQLLKAEDEDGVCSDGTMIRKAPYISTEEFNARLDRSLVQETLARRVGNCLKGELAQVICPAVGEQAIQSIVDKNKS